MRDVGGEMHHSHHCRSSCELEILEKEKKRERKRGKSFESTPDGVDYTRLTDPFDLNPLPRHLFA